MKRIGILALMFVVFSLLFLTNIASAIDTYQCADNQVILRISELTNSHGEKFLQTPFFTKEICYNEIFGKTYSGQGPHSCSQTNTVLRLVTDSNSHAAKNTYNLYPVRVCYGDLVCTMKASCSPGEVAVVKLSGDGTNSHIEVRNGNVYANTVCCSSVAAGIDPNKCGNGVVDAGEQCDGGVGTNTCQSLNLGFNGGTLGCNAKGTANQCMFNTAACTSPNGGDNGNNNGQTPQGCVTKTTKETCEAVTESNEKDILKADPSWRSSCDNANTVCACTWNANNNGGTCEFRRSGTQNTNNGGTCNDICDSASTTGQCVDGYLTVKISAKYNGNCQTPDPTCKSEEKTLLCGSPSLKLPFFSNVQIIATILSITLVYAIMLARRKR